MHAQFIELAEYGQWANSLVLDSLLKTPAVESRALKIFGHILAAEQVWLWRMTERDSSLLLIWPETDLGDCRERIGENHAGYREFLQSDAASDLSRPIDYHNSKGDPFSTPIVDILHQVSLHGAYHRGQVASAIKAAGGVPAVTDFIVFARQRGQA